MCLSEVAKKIPAVGCARCFVCDDARADKSPPLVPVWGQNLAFHWKNRPVYSDKSRASQLSQHDITAPESSFNKLHKLALVSRFFLFFKT